MRRSLGRVGVWTFGFDGRPAAAIAERRARDRGGGLPGAVDPGGRRLQRRADLPVVVARRERAPDGGQRHRQHQRARAGGAGPRRGVPARDIRRSARARRRRRARVHHRASRDRVGSTARADARATSTRWTRATRTGRRRRGCSRRSATACSGSAAERSLGRAHLLRPGRAHRAGARGARDRAGAGGGARGGARGGRDRGARASRARGPSHYLELPNYANNWRRLGFGEDDVAGGGSDRLRRCGVRVRGRRDRGPCACAPGGGRRPRLRAGDRFARRADEDIAALRALAPALLSA